jgi:hypothetical protein
MHRRGPEDHLKEDFILLVTAASGINNIGSKPKLIKVLEAIWEVGPDNTGSNETGTILSGVSVDEIKAGFTNVPRVRCCFNGIEKIRVILKKILEMDLGMSVALSGPYAEILGLCEELNIKPHSANFSLNVWGRTEKLPDEEIMQFVTMCGHGLISKTLVQDTIEKVKSGVMTPEKGAVRIGSPCVCGLFNPVRAVKELAPYAAEKRR